MKKMSITAKLISFVLAFITVFASMAILPFNTLDSEAAKKITEADIKAAKDRITANQKKIDDYEKKLSGLGTEIEDAIAAKELLDQQINSILTNIDETDALINEYSVLIAAKEEQITVREKEIDDKYSDFLERLRISYENGSQNYLELLLSSDSLISFITRIDNLGAVLSQEQILMEQLDKEVQELETMKNSLLEKKNELVELEKLQTSSRTELDKKLTDAENLIKQLEKDEVAAQKMYENAVASDAKLDKELEELLQKYEQQQLEAQKTKLLWPVDPDRRAITSKYGWRKLNGKDNFHLGIDIGVPYGKNIYAANGGTVVKATYDSSYGYYILINHGGNISTLYAHCSKLLVKAGEKVERGQVIAKIGSTGNSTGYHLHFEVRKNGKTTDPLVKNNIVIKYNGEYVDVLTAGVLRYY